MNHYIYLNQSEKYSNLKPKCSSKILESKEYDEFDLLKIISKRKDYEKTQGYVCLSTNNQRTHLLASGIDSILYLYDMKKMSEEAPKLFKSHKASFYSKSCLSPCGNYCLAGSDSEKGLCIWNTSIVDSEVIEGYQYLDKSTQFVYKCYQHHHGHVDNINGVDWCDSFAHPFIASSSDDRTICLWQ